MQKTSKCTIEVRFADIDAMGHVNNAIYLSYFEQARMHFFAELIGGEWDWSKDGIVLGRNEVDYRHPVFLNDRVEVETRCEAVGDKSMTVSYEVYSYGRSDKKTLCATGRSVLVGFDYERGVTCRIPDRWRQQLESSSDDVG